MCVCVRRDDEPALPVLRIVLVESIPEGLTYNSTVSPSTFEAWLKLLGEARRSVDIAAFYWTLQNEDTHTQEPSASQVSLPLYKVPAMPGLAPSWGAPRNWQVCRAASSAQWSQTAGEERIFPLVCR